MIVPDARAEGATEEPPPRAAARPRVGLIGITLADRDQAAELADVRITVARTGRLRVWGRQPPASDDLRRYTEACHRFGRGAGYATAG